MRWLIYVCTPANLRINYLQPCPYWVMKLLFVQNNCSLSVIHVLCLFPKNASVAMFVPRSTVCVTEEVFYIAVVSLLVFNGSWKSKLQKTSIRVYEELYEVIWNGKVILIEFHNVNSNTKTRQEGSMCLFCFGLNMQWEPFCWHK